ncbi:TPA: restriction endonuclease subunit S [Escherichia fergusonii]|uniref:restriction endonuclease subunit S n=2 Tax=Escherichia fergusonii TaxID=564 RepID=UPI0015E923D4|nr:restriction endonuclease subunit S [Escherichia fergusonii]EHJ4101670.1 restriction endonuclease subunit S [Escherichia fergusonii]QMF17860.1 restriction endonuclease subunit S [Escherichia fergusonii]QMH60319.1 restriction endonuclease subunit S [Escherichia fergusonii]HCO4394960.1 restriction endonuclease subunit S [Escherichia fergusonii]
MARLNKYQAYPEYRDSGVEWLGVIPNHWEKTVLKYLIELTPKKPSVSRENMLRVCSFVPMEKLKLNTLTLDEERITNQVYDGYTYFKDDDILIAKVTPCFENKNMAIAKKLKNGIGFGSSEIYVLRCNTKVYNKFLFYRLQENSFMAISIAAMTGAGGLKRVPSDTLNSYIFALPNILEQTKISDFLDHETAKIDKLIEKQQQLIELLKEKRQAVISHAVTKGLNPDVPMKDSGVEWLGNIPTHWEFKPLKSICQIINGSTPKSGIAEFWDGDINWITPTDLSQKSGLFITESARKITLAGYNSCGTTLVPRNSIIISTRAPIGSLAITSIESCTNQGCKSLITHDKNLSKFIYYSLSIITTPLNILGKGSTFLELSTEDLGSLRVSLPRDDVNSIVNFLDHETETIDTVIDKQLLQIELLKERRTALISAAVTGKIDLRNWTAPIAEAETPMEVSA